jgi:hypothetical protein
LDNELVSQTNTKKTSFKSVENILKNEPPKETPKQDRQYLSHYQSYWDAENTKKLQNSTLYKALFINGREYEVKIIDDVLNAKGVTLKPSETQM